MNNAKSLGHRGQVAVYLLMTLVAIFLLAILAVDVFIAVRAKNRLQNGGDAAAMAAARRQGEIVNEIGRLNIEHILAALAGNTNKCMAIGLEQRRLALVEPVYALRYASEAAERNGLEKNEDFAKILREHLNDVNTIYANGGGDDDPFPESYPGAWSEYATAIANIAAEGLAAGADNIEFYYAFGAHPLLNPDFYNAIAGADWCWFWFNEKNILDNYNSHADWGMPQAMAGNSTENSEFFSLHLSATTNALTSRLTFDEILDIANRYGNKRFRAADFTRDDGSVGCDLLDATGYTWFFFDASYWGRWFDGKRLANVDVDDDYEFPIVGEIKDEYNVRGCAAVCRSTITDVESLATGSKHANVWNAAAKPFGTVESPRGDIEPVTALNYFVAPCMTDVRLVSIDSVAQRNLGTADLAWFTHIRFHLADYIHNGPKRSNGCWYCDQLVAWERQAFRRRGRDWLKHHAGECIRTVEGSFNFHGGSSHGH